MAGRPTADEEATAFLQAVLPRLGYRWAGFRKVRRQVARRIRRRFDELGLESWDAYRRRLEEHPEERAVLDRLCRVTISRFFRDRSLWRVLGADVLPRLAGTAELGSGVVEAWSAGCASGEEPYSLAVLWHRELAPRFRGVRLRILASDVDLHLLARARRAVYPRGCLRELPAAWIAESFRELGTEELKLAPEERSGHAGTIHWLAHDLRTPPPHRRFDLVLCRNLAFTYFDRRTQERIGELLLGALAPGGWLGIGSHEEPPPGLRERLSAQPGERRLWRKA